MAKGSKEVRALLKIVVKQGGTWRTTGSGHFQIRNAEGRVIAITPGTASDHRSLANFRGDLRRGGITIE